MVKWLSLILLHIRNVPGSITDLEVGYPEIAASFSIYWEQMAIYYIRLGNKHFSTNPSHQIVYSRFRGFVPYRIMFVVDEGMALQLTMLNLQDEYRQLPWPVPLHVIQNSELQ